MLSWSLAKESSGTQSSSPGVVVVVIVGVDAIGVGIVRVTTVDGQMGSHLQHDRGWYRHETGRYLQQQAPSSAIVLAREGHCLCIARGVNLCGFCSVAWYGGHFRGSFAAARKAATAPHSVANIVTVWHRASASVHGDRRTTNILDVARILAFGMIHRVSSCVHARTV